MSAIRYVGTTDAKAAVSGHEHEVLKALGIPYDRGRPHIDCPYPTHGGKNDWRWDEKEKKAHCTCGCGHSIFDVVMNVEGIDFEAAKLRVVEILGRWDLIREATQRGSSSAESLLNRPPSERDDSLPRAYLAYRLRVEPDAVIMPATEAVGLTAFPYYDPPPGNSDKPTLVGMPPCTVWKMVGVDGGVHAHRIYVEPGGQGKADLGKTPDGKVRNPKKSAKRRDGQNISGYCVLFGDVERADHLIVAEGIETAAAVAYAFKPEVLSHAIVVAAGISAVGVEAVKPWPATRRITVAADRDEKAVGSKPPSRRGEKAAETLAAGLAGVLPIMMALPGESGESVDWLDVLLRDGVEAVRSGIMAVSPARHDVAASEEVVEGVLAFDPKAEIIRLSKLVRLDYERERSRLAKRLGIRPTALDELVQTARKRKSATDEAELFPAVEPWPSPVVPAELLDRARHTIRRFVVCEPEVSTAVALWVAFTWLIDRVQVAPLLIITAPEKRCGKSQLLFLVKLLSRRSLVASNITPAAVYRVIEAWAPTLVIDEADAFLGRSEEMRGILDSGHTRDSAYVIRLEGDDHEPRQFSTWGAKAIAGIGRLAETLVDRAIVAELRRKRADEKAERLRHADRGHFDDLARMFARFAEDAGETIESMRPTLPAELNDRAQDNWEPLLAIADYAGGHWPETARAAALQLSRVAQEQVSISVELLTDIRNAFARREGDKFPTADLLAILNADEEKPWATYHRGRPLTPRILAGLLGEFGIKSHNIWMPHGAAPKGYTRNQFADVFARYLPAKTSNDSVIAPRVCEGLRPISTPDLVGVQPLSPPPLPTLSQRVVPPPSAPQPYPQPSAPPPPPQRVVPPPSAPQPYPQPSAPPPPPQQELPPPPAMPPVYVPPPAPPPPRQSVNCRRRHGARSLPWRIAETPGGRRFLFR